MAFRAFFQRKIMVLILMGSIAARAIEFGDSYRSWFDSLAAVSSPAEIDSFPSRSWPEAQVYIYHPANWQAPLPAIFFAHGIGEHNPLAYEPLLSHLVSRGFVVVHAPYKAVPIQKSQDKPYSCILSGFQEAVAQSCGLIDTSRVGFIGHSYGGGAIPYIAHQCLVAQQWGSQGAFIFVMAPWYICNISEKELQQFPQHMRAVIEVFDEDRINDHRIAKDLFESLRIPLCNKWYIVLNSDSISGQRYSADHNVPVNSSAAGGALNNLDYYGVCRYIDALSGYILKGDSLSRVFLTSRDSSLRQRMGYRTDSVAFAPMKITSRPVAYRPQMYYINFWDHRMNPRNPYSRRFEWRLPMFYYTRVTLRNYVNTIKYRTALRHWDRQRGTSTVQCPIQPIKHGYGSHGKYFVDRMTIPNPRLRTKNIDIFLPRGKTSPCPVIFLAHSFLKYKSRYYDNLIEHIVSNGAIVVFAQYRILYIDPRQRRRYGVMMSGFEEAAQLVADKIDTTRIGFCGLSFGAGAIPAIAWHFTTEKHWGGNGSFMYLMAPWYMYHISQQQLDSFPSNMKLVVQVFSDDAGNDWRIGQDIWLNTNIPESEKEFIVVHSDRRCDYTLIADYAAPLGTGSHVGEEDAIDYYAIYRVFDALADYAFTGSLQGKKIALGKGDSEQTFMGTWPDGAPVKQIEIMTSGNFYVPAKKWLYPWNHILNERTWQLESRSSRRE